MVTVDRALFRMPHVPPEALEAIYACGYTLLEAGRHGEAARVFRFMLRCAPTSERSWLALGACHQESGDDDLALELYGAATVAARPAPRCRIARARILRARGERDAADVEVLLVRRHAEGADDEELLRLVAAEEQGS
jgi:hypothetical protein